MDKVIKLSLLALVIVFFILVFSSSGGYYEYELNKKSNLTEEAIKQFEQDVKEGREIDINDYVVKEKKDYSNTFSKLGLKLSNKIGTIFKEGVKFIFNSVGNLVDE